MKPELVEYKPEHAIRILTENAREEELTGLMGQSPQEFIKMQQGSGPAWTLVVGEQIIGCGGIILCSWRRGVTWLLLSRLFYKYTLNAIKAIKAQMQKVVEEHDLIRLELETLADSKTNARFAEWLGFELEGLKRCYGPNGEDFFLFAKIFKRG